MRRGHGFGPTDTTLMKARPKARRPVARGRRRRYRAHLQNGVPEDQRERAMERIVWILGHRGYSTKLIEAELNKFPLGLRAGFGERLTQEIERLYKVCLQKEQQPKLDELNIEWSVVIDGARTRVLRFMEDDINGRKRELAEFLSAADFYTFYRNRTVWLGAKRYEPLGTWWLGSPRSLSISRPSFSPRRRGQSHRRPAQSLEGLGRRTRKRATGR